MNPLSPPTSYRRHKRQAGMPTALLALAGLKHVFVTQLPVECGRLNAQGWRLPQLVWRVESETLFTSGAAWLVGLLGCAAILAYLHLALYAPRGLRLDFFNPNPWLNTLPIPATVFVVGTGPVARMLSKLDPVAIGELSPSRPPPWCNRAIPPTGSSSSWGPPTFTCVRG